MFNECIVTFVATFSLELNQPSSSCYCFSFASSFVCVGGCTFLDLEHLGGVHEFCPLCAQICISTDGCFGSIVTRHAFEPIVHGRKSGFFKSFSPFLPGTWSAIQHSRALVRGKLPHYCVCKMVAHIHAVYRRQQRHPVASQSRYAIRVWGTQVCPVDDGKTFGKGEVEESE